jgi:RNA polymerase sigma-70 factor, ECF subfamily
LSEAFAAALQEWPLSGVPKNPAGWLAVAARRRLVDAGRRRRSAETASDDLRLMDDELREASESSAEAIPDRRLALMFVCAHPAIEASIHAPLMLQTVLGLDAAAIASAFLVAPATMGQRLSRAKAKIRLAGVPFRVPERVDLAERLDAVLDAIYAAFSFGWGEAFGDSRGRDLAHEAIWLARVAASLAPDQPEALGLLALMLFADARRAARRDATGRYVPLGAQDIARWDASAIDEAETILHCAAAFKAPGRFQLEAAIQSAHAARRHSGAVDWSAIMTLYDGLFAITGSPVVAVNRAVAAAQARGADAGLALLEAVETDGDLAEFQPFWAAKAELCARAGRVEDALNAYARAAGLETDPAVRAFLMERRAALVH